MSGPEDDTEDSGYGQALRSAGPLIGSGIQLAASVAIMFFLGRWLDEKFLTYPWLMIVCMTFGVGAGLYNFITTVTHLDAPKSEKKNHV